MRSEDLDPQGSRLPIKIDATSNGEFEPRPLGEIPALGNRLAAERVGENARRTGLSRRGFLVSAMGAATTLLVHNNAHAASSAGGFYEWPSLAAVDRDAADELLAKREFIFKAARAEYLEAPTPAFRTFGPKNRREFLNLKTWGA